MTWEKHVPEDERSGLIEQADDGSAIFLSSRAGGAAAAGHWSTLTLMRVDASGSYEFRNYAAAGGWHCGLSDAPAVTVDETALEYASNAFVTEGASMTIRKGQVVGRENFDLRMRKAIAAYLRQASGKERQP